MPTCPRGHDTVATDYCDECGTPIGAAVTPAPAPAAAPEQAPAAGGEPCPDCATPRTGRFCEVCGWDFQAEAPSVAFPAFCPERRFALHGTQLLIGRRSRSRGIEPDIDLTGPPEDAGVSHAHALLVSTPDGGWNVVDLDSANGTYLNEGTDPIEANVPVAVKAGDRIHLGAWTTL